MLCYKDRTFCDSSGTCANRQCPRWIDFGKEYPLPVALSQLKGTGDCPGYEKAQSLAALERAITATGLGLRVK